MNEAWTEQFFIHLLAIESTESDGAIALARLDHQDPAIGRELHRGISPYRCWK